MLATNILFVVSSGHKAESELKVLQILWDAGPRTVRYVNDKLNIAKTVGYTTTLKIMQIMHEKGILSREAEGRTHVYTSILKQEDAQKFLLDRMVDAAFGGSANSLVLRVLGDYKTSPEELKKIKELINKIEEDQS